METGIDWAVAIAVIMTPVAIGAGFLFAHRQLKSARNARMAQLVVSLHRVWNSREMKQSRNKVNEAGGNLKKQIAEADAQESPELYYLVDVGNFFDQLGTLVMHGYLDKDTAYDLFSRAEEHYYQIYRPVLEDLSYRDFLHCFPHLHSVFEKERTRRENLKPRSSI
jgi:hypothetical protein